MCSGVLFPGDPGTWRSPIRRICSRPASGIRGPARPAREERWRCLTTVRKRQVSCTIAFLVAIFKARPSPEPTSWTRSRHGHYEPDAPAHHLQELQGRRRSSLLYAPEANHGWMPCTASLRAGITRGWCPSAWRTEKMGYLP